MLSSLFIHFLFACLCHPFHNSFYHRLIVICLMCCCTHWIWLCAVSSFEIIRMRIWYNIKRRLTTDKRNGETISLDGNKEIWLNQIQMRCSGTMLHSPYFSVCVCVRSTPCVQLDKGIFFVTIMNFTHIAGCCNNNDNISTMS